MLNGISPLISPDLLATLSRMGHGDRIVLADAHFPGHSVNDLTLRADGIPIRDLLEGLLPLFPIDAFIPDPLIMMAPVEGDRTDPAVANRYREVFERHAPSAPAFVEVERHAFYRLAQDAFAVVMTGDTAKYANLVLTKGLVEVS